VSALDRSGNRVGKAPPFHVSEAQALVGGEREPGPGKTRFGSGVAAKMLHHPLLAEMKLSIDSTRILQI
jgi:hypothetical protein